MTATPDTASTEATERLWQWVPVEPTEQMLAAANRASLSTEVLLDETRYSCDRAMWTGALSAAPHPPVNQSAAFDAVVQAALPFAQHDWMDAELEDDNCKLTKHSGPITVGHWRALRSALALALAKSSGGQL